MHSVFRKQSLEKFEGALFSDFFKTFPIFDRARQNKKYICGLFRHKTSKIHGQTESAEESKMCKHDNALFNDDVVR